MASFGLDIGSHSVKAVELAREGENWRLLAAGVSEVPSPGMQSENEKDLLAVSTAVRKLHSDAKISTPNVVLALPETQVFTRPVKFPALTEKEVASAIQWEAEQYIPIPISEAVVDYQIIGTKQDQTGQTEVLLVAAPKVLVEKYMKVARNAGLKPIAVETELVALARSIGPAGKTALVVDFGATSTDIAITRDKQLVFSRSIPTAGEAFTRAVSQSLGVDPSQAEEYKRTYGLAAGKLEGKIKTAIDPIFRVVVDELKKAIQYWVSQEQGSDVQVAVLTGGTAGLPEVAPLIANSFGIEVTIGDPFATLIKNEALGKQLAPFAPLYAIAVGLAQREGG